MFAGFDKYLVPYLARTKPKSSSLCQSIEPCNLYRWYVFESKAAFENSFSAFQKPTAPPEKPSHTIFYVELRRPRAKYHN